uniref:Septin-9-like n=1 Tax=Petromyzon marinus TaxID=7757 RepID=A0AAJ7UJC6_PETMA|nr:septin-9-like [Petromyzon marinus]
MAEAWRRVQESVSSMVDFIRAVEDSELALGKLNVLMIGKSGNGKSSFLNTVDTAIIGRYSFRAMEAQNDGYSQTIQLKMEELDQERIKKTSIRLMDTVGWVSGVYNIDLFSSILCGKVPKDYYFGNLVNFSVVPENRVHCLVYVVSVDALINMDRDELETFAKFGQLARRMEINVFGILTKVDFVMPDDEWTSDTIYRSRQIKQMMEMLGDSLGCPLKYIFPVSNYADSTILHEERNRLAMHAFSTFIHAAVSYVKR